MILEQVPNVTTTEASEGLNGSLNMTEPVVFKLWDQDVELAEIDSVSVVSAGKIRTGEPSGDDDNGDAMLEPVWNAVHSGRQRRKSH